jgi:ketosteroid isomerase-like protein
MSQANIDVVRRCFDLFVRGDHVGTLAYFDPAVETVEPNELPGAATYLGYEGLAAAFSHFADVWAEYSVELERVAEAGDRVVAVVRYRGTGKASGVRVETTAGHVYAFKGGKIVRWRMLDTESQAREVVGLRE